MMLKHKNILITGASRGLGYELARYFWGKGANLFLVVRSKESKLEDFTSQFRQTDQRLHYFFCDLSQDENLHTLVNHLQDLPIHVLINNAAIQGPVGSVWENEWEAWKTTLAINLFAPIFLCRALVPLFIHHENNGVILNLSGGGATGPRPCFSAYATAKTGLVRFSETLAHEVKNSKIRVNCIAPGPLPTEMFKENMKAREASITAKEWKEAEKTLGMNADAFHRVARLCEFLISDAAEEISGRLISALWDPWEDAQHFSQILKDPNLYTLRRVALHDSSHL